MIIDLSHTIEENMTVFPNTEKPKIEVVAQWEKNLYKETKLSLYSHIGTHIDSSNHLFKDGISLDKMKIDNFVGKGIVIDCRDLNRNETIEIEKLNKKTIKDADFILFNTGWDKKWNTAQYLSTYPCISEEVAKYLVSENKKGIGLDTISADRLDELKIHKILLNESNFIIIENLMNLDLIGRDIFELFALPIKYKDADGAWARVIAKTK